MSEERTKEEGEVDKVKNVVENVKNELGALIAKVNELRIATQDSALKEMYDRLLRLHTDLEKILSVFCINPAINIKLDYNIGNVKVTLNTSEIPIYSYIKTSNNIDEIVKALKSSVLEKYEYIVLETIRTIVKVINTLMSKINVIIGVDNLYDRYIELEKKVEKIAEQSDC